MRIILLLTLLILTNGCAGSLNAGSGNLEEKVGLQIHNSGSENGTNLVRVKRGRVQLLRKLGQQLWNYRTRRPNTIFRPDKGPYTEKKNSGKQDRLPGPGRPLTQEMFNKRWGPRT